MKQETTLKGSAIVIVERGWVFQGNVEISKDWCIITNTKNIRRWGASNGLGELAKKGPLSDTKCDEYGVVRVPIHSVIAVIETEASLWNK